MRKNPHFKSIATNFKGVTQWDHVQICLAYVQSYELEVIFFQIYVPLDIHHVNILICRK
jgi:hypothetical protein